MSLTIHGSASRAQTSSRAQWGESPRLPSPRTHANCRVHSSSISKLVSLWRSRSPGSAPLRTFCVQSNAGARAHFSADLYALNTEQQRKLGKGFRLFPNADGAMVRCALLVPFAHESARANGKTISAIGIPYLEDRTGARTRPRRQQASTPPSPSSATG